MLGQGGSSAQTGAALAESYLCPRGPPPDGAPEEIACGNGQHGLKDARVEEHGPGPYSDGTIHVVRCWHLHTRDVPQGVPGCVHTRQPGLRSHWSAGRRASPAGEPPSSAHASAAARARRRGARPMEGQASVTGCDRHLRHPRAMQGSHRRGAPVISSSTRRAHRSAERPRSTWPGRGSGLSP